jgi:hypothetical protein
MLLLICGSGSLYNVRRIDKLNRSPSLYKNQLAKLPFKHFPTCVASGIGRRNCNCDDNVESFFICASLSIACLLLSSQSADHIDTNNLTHCIPAEMQRLQAPQKIYDHLVHNFRTLLRLKCNLEKKQAPVKTIILTTVVLLYLSLWMSHKFELTSLKCHNTSIIIAVSLVICLAGPHQLLAAIL